MSTGIHDSISTGMSEIRECSTEGEEDSRHHPLKNDKALVPREKGGKNVSPTVGWKARVKGDGIAKGRTSPGNWVGDKD